MENKEQKKDLLTDNEMRRVLNRRTEERCLLLMKMNDLYFKIIRTALNDGYILKLERELIATTNKCLTLNKIDFQVNHDNIYKFYNQYLRKALHY